MLWTHGQEKLDLFIQHINSCHDTIKFTAESSRTQVTFLDTKIIITNDDDIITDLYTKPTDSHNYLLYTSCHPGHTKRSLPYSQFLRIKRICTKIQDFEQQCTNLIKYLLDRGYPLHTLVEDYEKVHKMDRNELLEKTKTEKQDDTKLFNITTFHPLNNPVKDVLDISWKLLQRSSTTRPLFNKKVVHGFRRTKNLRDLLVTSRTNFHPEAPKQPKLPLAESSNKCTTKNCRYCPRIDTTGKIFCTTRKCCYTSKKQATCKSHNLIYGITCNTCKIQYVGQTKRRLMDRFQGHFYNIKNKNEQIGRHFTSQNNHGIEDVTIHILSFITQPGESTRAQEARNKVELAWIHRLCTYSPFSLNILD